MDKKVAVWRWFRRASSQWVRVTKTRRPMPTRSPNTGYEFHGPSTSAAFELLQRNNAAIFLTTLDPKEIASSLAKIDNTLREKVVTNALALAGREFMIADQTRKFWNTICGCIRAL